MQGFGRDDFPVGKILSDVVSLKFCLATNVDVERSCSKHKEMLRTITALQ